MNSQTVTTEIGDRLRYEWDFDPHMDIYVCRFDGTGLEQLTDSPGYDAEGSYSHDGEEIVRVERDGRKQLVELRRRGRWLGWLPGGLGWGWLTRGLSGSDGRKPSGPDHHDGEARDDEPLDRWHAHSPLLFLR